MSNQNFSCKICNTSFQTLTGYRKHIFAFHVASADVFVCIDPRCRYTTHVFKNLRKHFEFKHATIEKQLLESVKRKYYQDLVSLKSYYILRDFSIYSDCYNEVQLAFNKKKFSTPQKLYNTASGIYGHDNRKHNSSSVGSSASIYDPANAIPKNETSTTTEHMLRAIRQKQIMFSHYPEDNEQPESHYTETRSNLDHSQKFNNQQPGNNHTHHLGNNHTSQLGNMGNLHQNFSPSTRVDNYNPYHTDSNHQHSQDAHRTIHPEINHQHKLDRYSVTTPDPNHHYKTAHNGPPQQEHTVPTKPNNTRAIYSDMNHSPNFRSFKTHQLDFNSSSNFTDYTTSHQTDITEQTIQQTIQPNSELYINSSQYSHNVYDTSSPSSISIEPVADKEPHRDNRLMPIIEHFTTLPSLGLINGEIFTKTFCFRCLRFPSNIHSHKCVRHQIDIKACVFCGYVICLGENSFIHAMRTEQSIQFNFVEYKRLEIDIEKEKKEHKCGRRVATFIVAKNPERPISREFFDS